MMRIRLSLFALALLASTGAAAGCAAKASPANTGQPSRRVRQAVVARCLHRLLLSYESLEGRELGKPLTNFAGLTGTILVTASPNPSNLGARATIDTVQLFFFQNPHDARHAQAGLARYYVYFQGPFSYLKLLRPVPPDAAALHSIERIVGNVDIFWNYPRRHPKSSDRTLTRCLDSG